MTSEPGGHGRPRPRARMVGINHVALEVGDLDAAVAFYRQVFDLGPVDREEAGMAFLGMGDQFLALSEVADAVPQRGRHFGLVVDDKERVRAALTAAGVAISRGSRLNFRDPWGNHLQVVDYRDVQFIKAPGVLRAMGLSGEKRPGALEELRANGLLDDRDQPAVPRSR